MDNYSIIDQKSQSILKRIEERMMFKESLQKYIEKIYNGECGEIKIESESEHKAENFKNCATGLFIDPETSQIVGANFCKQRLCPVCNYRRSTMLWHKVKNIINEINEDMLLITLTVKNCPGNELKATIDNILESFHRITSRRTWKENFIGFIRGLEITYNAEKDTFHPHIHIIAVTDQEYYKSKYVDVHTLRQWWTESARLDYHVQVDIRKIKDKDKGIAEVVKYAVKMADILQQDTDERRMSAVQTLAACINKRRLISTGGIIKKIAKQKNITLEEFDLEEKYESQKRAIYYEYNHGKYEKKIF